MNALQRATAWYNALQKATATACMRGNWHLLPPVASRGLHRRILASTISFSTKICFWSTKHIFKTNNLMNFLQNVRIFKRSNYIFEANNLLSWEKSYVRKWNHIFETKTTTFLYMDFLNFAKAPAGDALPAKRLFRVFIFSRGANWKCPAREILNFEILNFAGVGARREQPPC